MTYRGTVKGGVVVLEGKPDLAEGQAVEVRAVAEPENEHPTLYERYKDVFGKAEGLPEDFAAEHDHYIHGTPKRSDRT